MPKETWVDFKAVKAAVSMEMVLARYGLLTKLTRKGDRLVGLCPIHHKGADAAQSNRQQFTVSVAPGKPAFKCFAGSCGKKGNQIDLVAALEGISFRDAALKLAEWFNVDCGKADGQEQPKAKAPAEEGRAPAGKPATAEPSAENKALGFELHLDAEHPYLAERGLTAETVAHFGLGAAQKGSMKGRIAIPIHDQGNLVAYAGRWIGPDATIPEGEGKYKLPPGFRKGLVVFNAHRVPEGTKRVILVEGFWSVFWLHQNGYPNAISVMGSMVTPQQVELLAGRFKGVQVFFDGDAAGREGSRKVALELAPRLWVRIVDCPDGLQPDRLPAHELKRLLG